MNTQANKSKLDEFLKYTRGQFMGFHIQDRKIPRGYVFSGKVTKVTPNFVDVKPYSGMFRGETRFHKNSIERLVGFAGVEYNRENSR